jgi:hypothetical protein
MEDSKKLWQGKQGSVMIVLVDILLLIGVASAILCIATKGMTYLSVEVFSTILANFILNYAGERGTKHKILFRNCMIMVGCLTVAALLNTYAGLIPSSIMIQLVAVSILPIIALVRVDAVSCIRA